MFKAIRKKARIRTLLARCRSDAVAASSAAGFPLPPGKFDRLERLEKTDRHAVLKKQELYGNVFLSTWFQHVLVCIVDVAHGRAFVQANSKSLEPFSIDTRELFPKGMLRMMEGADHRHYRSALGKIFKATLSGVDSVETRSFVTEKLDQLQLGNSPAAEPAMLSRVLSEITTGLLVQILLGLSPDEPVYDETIRSFNRLGPDTFVWKIEAAQKTAFEDLLRGLTSPEYISSGSVLGKTLKDIEEQSDPDVDVRNFLGNLIYMIEMGRYDLSMFFRWLLVDLKARPLFADTLRAEQGKARCRELSEAFVREALRMDQSERVLRVTTEDIIWKNFFIPKESFVRIGLWEAHKNGAVFDQPFQFDETRFVGQKPGPDQYSPFGIDHHKCLAAQLVTKIAALFLEELILRFDFQITYDGKPKKALEMWKPGDTLSLTLRKLIRPEQTIAEDPS